MENRTQEKVKSALPESNSDMLRILVVDDSQTERLLFSAVLQRFGHEVIEACSGNEALTQVTENLNKIDLILLDVNMPDFNGYELAKKIRDLECEQAVEWCPIIFLSGSSSPEDIAMGIESGGDDFISKPPNSKTLQAKIMAMSRISNMRKRLIEIQKQLERQANYDEMTDIPNRRYFFAQLEKEIARSRRYDFYISIAYFDIDKFKSVNDSMGHKTGDQVLIGVAQEIQNQLRQEDMVGRLGGEEFCVYLVEQNLEKTKLVVERLRQAIEALRFQYQGQEFHVTASFGIAELTKDDTVDSLIEKADDLLYKAKNNGRNRVEC